MGPGRRSEMQALRRATRPGASANANAAAVRQSAADRRDRSLMGAQLRRLVNVYPVPGHSELTPGRHRRDSDVVHAGYPDRDRHAGDDVGSGNREYLDAVVRNREGAARADRDGVYLYDGAARLGAMCACASDPDGCEGDRASDDAPLGTAHCWRIPLHDAHPAWWFEVG